MDMASIKDFSPRVVISKRERSRHTFLLTLAASLTRVWAGASGSQPVRILIRLPQRLQPFQKLDRPTSGVEQVLPVPMQEALWSVRRLRLCGQWLIHTDLNWR